MTVPRSLVCQRVIFRWSVEHLTRFNHRVVCLKFGHAAVLPLFGFSFHPDAGYFTDKILGEKCLVDKLFYEEVFARFVLFWLQTVWVLMHSGAELGRLCV